MASPPGKVVEGRGEAVNFKRSIVERRPLPAMFSTGHDHIDRYTLLRFLRSKHFRIVNLLVTF